MITILHLITGLEVGGAERMLAHIASCSDRRRFRSVVVSMTGTGRMGPLFEAAGVPVRSLDLRRGVPDPRGILRFLRILREYRPDILQTWLYHADLLGLIARQLSPTKRLLWNLRCTEMEGTAGLTRLLAWGSGVPEAVIVNSYAGQRYHETLGYQSRRWVMIPNGFDTECFRPDTGARRRGRAELGISDDAVALLLPARYDAMKDHANFLAAAAKLAGRHPEAQFALAGAGAEPGNRELSEAIAAHGLADRIRLLGERRDIEALYPTFDIVTLSSAFGEGFPNVLGEAMACGVPCVATDIGDAAAIIGDCGIVVPARDPEALAAGWQRLMGLGAHGRAALGARARARIVEHYDLALVVARFEVLYDEIAGGDQPNS
ncbi:MAG TPA: glycosyltransferase [Acetobacteraceae bacterium]|nr:glycosyltransferase [Acetobacteraceae bacterium]